MNDGKQQIKSWLNRVLRIVGRDDQEGDERWSPASNAGQQLELDMEVPVNALTASAARRQVVLANRKSRVKRRTQHGVSIKS